MDRTIVSLPNNCTPNRIVEQVGRTGKLNVFYGNVQEGFAPENNQWGQHGHSVTEGGQTTSARTRQGKKL